MNLRILAALLPCCGLAGQTWIHLDGPSYTGRSAAFDWARGRLVMRGHEGATWEFAGNALLNRPFFGNGPSPRGRTAMAFDLLRRRIVMFGGVDTANQALGDTWAWDGVRWTQLGGPQPPARMDAAMTYDIWRDRMVLHGVKPDPYIDRDSVARDLEAFLRVGVVKERVAIDRLVDDQYVKYAVDKLGKYE